MKLAVSCIAWDVSDEDLIRSILIEEEIKFIETVPGRVGINGGYPVNENASAYKKAWDDQGLKLIAMQSLLFGFPDLLLFRDVTARSELLKHLSKVFEAGQILGVERYVFGSPKNRIKGSLNKNEALEIAAKFFSSAAKLAEQYNGCLCIEANPPEYGGDFILSTEDAVLIVNMVEQAGFGLHLDTGGMILAGENITEVVEKYGQRTQHFHVSLPNLQPIYQDGLNTLIKEGITALRKVGYSGYISLEMKGLPAGSNQQQRLEHVRRGIHSLKELIC